jgi:hypothetical protein
VPALRPPALATGLHVARCGKPLRSPTKPPPQRNRHPDRVPCTCTKNQNFSKRQKQKQKPVQRSVLDPGFDYALCGIMRYAPINNKLQMQEQEPSPSPSPGEKRPNPHLKKCTRHTTTGKKKMPILHRRAPWQFELCGRRLKVSDSAVIHQDDPSNRCCQASRVGKSSWSICVVCNVVVIVVIHVVV